MVAKDLLGDWLSLLCLLQVWDMISHPSTHLQLPASIESVEKISNLKQKSVDIKALLLGQKKKLNR